MISRNEKYIGSNAILYCRQVQLKSFWLVIIQYKKFDKDTNICNFVSKCFQQQCIGLINNFI